MAKLTKKEKYIADMYVTYFGVAADTATIKEYTKFTTTKVLAEIEKDAEISQIGFSNEEVVNNTFQNIFGRNATPQELNKHVKALEKNNKINVNSIVKNAKSADKAVNKNKKDIAKFVAENGGAELDLSKISAANKIDVKSLTSLTDLQTKLDALPDNDYTISAYDGKDFILTAGVDVGAKFVGTSKNDTFHATETTLQAGDIINGHTGTDRLKISDNVGTTFTGFEAKNIEVIEVTSDNGATFVDLTYATEATKLVNANSSKNVKFDNIQEPIKTVELVKVTDGDTLVDFDVDAGLEGTADSIEVVLNNVKGTDGKAMSTIRGTYDDLAKQKIETVNVKVTGTNSVIKDIAFGQTTVNIAGNKDLTIDDAGITLNGTTKIDASAFKGNLTLGALDSALNKDVSVIGGLGNDKVSFENGFNTNTTDATKKDSFDGGAGIDTIVLTNAQATGTTFGSLVNVEQLEVSNIAVTSTIDMDNFSGVNKVIYSKGVTAANTATIADASNDITVEVVSIPSSNGTLDVKLKTDTASDTVNVIVDKVTAVTEAFNTIKADTAETLNLTVNDLTTDAITGKLTLGTLSAQAAKTVNVTATSDLQISAVNNPVNSVLTLLDASTSTGKLTIAGLNTAAAGATIKLGSGDDTYTVATSNGADTITLGAGKDTIIYNAVAQSNGVKFDTITDFVSGTDKINLAAFAGADASSDFVGSYNTYGDAVAALKGKAGAVVPSSVFDASSNSLWVDVDGDGSLTAVDFRIKLDGVTAITAADLGFLSGNTIGLSSSNAKISKTDAVGSDKSTTDQDDTITTTYDNLRGSSINGELGIDTLTVSGTFVSSLSLNTTTGGNADLTSIEKVIFNNVSGPLTLTNLKDIHELTVNGSDSALTLAATNATLNKITVNNTNGFSGSNITVSAATAAGLVVTTGAANDTINAAAAANALTINSGNGIDTITVSNTAATVTTVNAGAGDDIINATTAGAANDDIIDGGLGNDILNITGNHTFATDANLVNVETITIATGANTTLVLSAQTEGFTINGNTGDDTITAGSGNDIINGGAGNDTINAGAGNNTITGGAGADAITLGAGVDTIQGLSVANQSIAASADTLTAAGIVATDTITFATGAAGSVDTIAGFAAGIDKLDVTNASTAPTTLIGANSGTALTDGTVYVLYGSYNATTGVFTAAAAYGAGNTDALIVEGDGTQTIVNEQDSVILTGLTAALTAADFI